MNETDPHECCVEYGFGVAHHHPPMDCDDECREAHAGYAVVTDPATTAIAARARGDWDTERAALDAMALLERQMADLDRRWDDEYTDLQRSRDEILEALREANDARDRLLKEIDRARAERNEYKAKAVALAGALFEAERKTTDHASMDARDVLYEAAVILRFQDDHGIADAFDEIAAEIELPT